MVLPPRRPPRPRLGGIHERGGPPLRLTAAVLSVVIGVGAGVQVYRIGDSGAKAAWHDGYSATAHSDRG